MTSTLIALLAACSGGTTSQSPEITPRIPAAETPPEVAEAVAEAKPDEPAVGGTLTLSLDPELISYDEGAGTATFSPDSRRMTSHYTRYVMDLASLEAALGGRPEQPVDVVVTLTAVSDSSHTPADPNLPAPQGGFQYTDWTATVTGKAE